MEKHLTQKQLARKAGRGMTQAFISKIEARRHKEPNFSTLVRMAEALDCNLEITVKPK